MKHIFILFIVFFSLTNSLYGQYISSTTTQANNPVIYPNTIKNVIIRLEIEIGTIPVTLFSLECNNNGSTSPSMDISNAKLWYYNDSSVFNANLALLIGTCYPPWVTNYMFLTAPSATYTGMSSFSNLIYGKNYFWLTYDIPSNATICNLLDADFIGIRVNNVNYYPTIMQPPGNSIIGNCPISIAENPTSSNIIIYPIPSSDQITVELDCKNNTNVTVELLDITGKRMQILLDNALISGKPIHTFSLDKYDAGFYFIKTIFDDREVIRKISIL